MGGGGSKAKSKAQVINESAMDIVQRSVLTCRGAVSQSAIMKVALVKGDFKMGDFNSSQAATIKTNCVMEAKKQAEIQQAISNMLAQQAEASGVAGLGWMGSTKSETALKILNKFKASFVQEDIVESISAVTQTAGLEIGTIEGDWTMGNVNIDQSASVIAEALLQSNSYSSVINDITNDIEQKSTATEAGLVSSTTMIIIFIIVILVAGGGGYVYYQQQQGQGFGRMGMSGMRPMGMSGMRPPMGMNGMSGMRPPMIPQQMPQQMQQPFPPRFSPPSVPVNLRPNMPTPTYSPMPPQQPLMQQQPPSNYGSIPQRQF